MDAHAEDHFNLRALLFVTTNDWQALSNLSGQSNKGYRACTHYLEETDSMYLKHCRKIVYMGHRRFLPIKHPLRRRHAHYDGKADHRTKPRHRCGKMVFEMVKDIKVVFEKDPTANQCRVMTDVHLCGRRRIFFGSYLIGKS